MNIASIDRPLFLNFCLNIHISFVNLSAVLDKHEPLSHLNVRNDNFSLLFL